MCKQVVVVASVAGRRGGWWGWQGGVNMGAGEWGGEAVCVLGGVIVASSPCSDIHQCLLHVRQYVFP